MAYPRTPEHNLLRALPFFLVALLLALMGWAGYRDYKDLHRNPKPKHETAEWVTYSGSGGQAEIIPYTKLHPDGDCVSQVNGHVLCNPDAYGRPCKRIASGGWQCGDPSLKVWNPGVDYAFQVTRPRKHKRKTIEGYPPAYDFYIELRFINTIPAQLTCTRRTKTSGMVCQSRPLTPAEIEQYKPKPQPSDEGMMNAEDHIIIEPGFSIYDYQYHGGIKPIVPAPSDEGRIDFSQPSHAWTVAPIAKPSCVMPADIDVCPVQMLDPKAANDMKRRGITDLLDGKRYGSHD